MVSTVQDLPHSSVVEAASWRLATGIVRRHPDLVIRREHPGGGQSDCLAVRSSRGLLMYLNRVGTIQLHGMENTSGDPNWQPTEWRTSLTAKHPRSFGRELETAARLPDVAQTPENSPAVLVYRLLTAIASLHVLAEPVAISMRTIDSSGYGGGPAEWLQDFPWIAERIRAGQADPFGFWHARARGRSRARADIAGWDVVEPGPSIIRRDDAVKRRRSELSATAGPHARPRSGVGRLHSPGTQPGRC